MHMSKACMASALGMLCFGNTWLLHASAPRVSLARLPSGRHLRSVFAQRGNGFCCWRMKAARLLSFGLLLGMTACMCVCWRGGGGGGGLLSHQQGYLQLAREPKLLQEMRQPSRPCLPRPLNRPMGPANMCPSLMFVAQKQGCKGAWHANTPKFLGLLFSSRKLGLVAAPAMACYILSIGRHPIFGQPLQ